MAEAIFTVGQYAVSAMGWAAAPAVVSPSTPPVMGRATGRRGVDCDDGDDEDDDDDVGGDGGGDGAVGGCRGVWVRPAVRAVRSGTTIVFDAVVASWPLDPCASPRAPRRRGRCPSTPTLPDEGVLGLARSSGPWLGRAIVFDAAPRGIGPGGSVRVVERPTTLVMMMVMTRMMMVSLLGSAVGQGNRLRCSPVRYRALWWRLSR